MSDDGGPEPQLPSEPGQGPCLFGNDHSFNTTYVTDPFTNETSSVTCCTGCGWGAG